MSRLHGHVGQAEGREPLGSGRSWSSQAQSCHERHFGRALEETGSRQRAGWKDDLWWLSSALAVAPLRQGVREEPQPSHMGGSVEHVRALSGPSLNRGGRETSCPLLPKSRERPLAQTGTGFRAGPSASSTPWAGVLFVRCSDSVFASFWSPKRHQVREAFEQAQSVGWATSFLPTTH